MRISFFSFLLSVIFISGALAQGAENDSLRSETNRILRNSENPSGVHDGMDIAICSYHVPSDTFRKNL